MQNVQSRGARLRGALVLGIALAATAFAILANGWAGEDLLSQPRERNFIAGLEALSAPVVARAEELVPAVQRPETLMLHGRFDDSHFMGQINGPPAADSFFDVFFDVFTESDARTGAVRIQGQGFSSGMPLMATGLAEFPTMDEETVMHMDLDGMPVDPNPIPTPGDLIAPPWEIEIIKFFRQQGRTLTDRGVKVASVVRVNQFGQRYKVIRGKWVEYSQWIIRGKRRHDIIREFRVFAPTLASGSLLIDLRAETAPGPEGTETVQGTLTVGPPPIPPGI